MSRVLKTGDNQITQNYVAHCNKVASGNGWAKGTDVVKKSCQTDYIIAHSQGTIIKVVDYMSGTNGIVDKEAMGYGNYVMILHDNNYVTLYAHLSSVNNLKQGQKILKGTVVGHMGNTGMSFGSHLHFELRKYKDNPNMLNIHNTSAFEWLNPEPYLDADLPASSNVSNDYYNNTIPNRFKVIKDGKQIASYTNYTYAVNYAISNNAVVIDSADNNKQIFPQLASAKKELTKDSYPNYIGKAFYRVRKDFKDEKTAIGSFSVFANAYKKWYDNKDKGYHLYDNSGKQLD